MERKTPRGLTLVELVVVLLILSLLATIAATVYTGNVQRAKFAVARTEIRQLELNVARYEVDLGVFPISSSGTRFGGYAPDPEQNLRFDTANGCGYLILCLQHSMSGNTFAPADVRWHGPYMELQQQKLGEIADLTGRIKLVTSSSIVPHICLLDPWDNPYYYVHSSDYETFGGTQQTNTPFAALGETFYNPSTFQIFSLGPDGTTLNAPNAGLGTDDINNFSAPQ
jgi:prepilin-type N-terminal cleavage/methylation domain-containing protein